MRAALDRVLPDGLDIDEAVVAGPGSLPERMQASVWRIELPGVDEDTARAALDVPGPRRDRRRTGAKTGRRTLDVRAPVVRAEVSGAAPDALGAIRATMTLVVRQVTPTVRPDDLVVALRDVAGLAPAGPPIAVRLAQGPLDDDGAVGDPLETDRSSTTTPS